MLCGSLKACLFSYVHFQPSEHRGTLLPDCDATFELFDRVVNIKLNATVPFGLRGTVIGIHEGNVHRVSRKLAHNVLL